MMMITQENLPRCKWPFPQDWIVSRVRFDRQDGKYHLYGKNLNRRLPDGDYEQFVWGMWAYDRPLSWRYDLTNAVYEETV